MINENLNHNIANQPDDDDSEERGSYVGILHQSNANLLAEAAETIQHDDFEKRVAEAVDGEEFNSLLESLPFSVYGDGQSHTYNRVIKVLVREGIIDASSVVAWNRANRAIKARVFDVIRKITVVTPNDVLLKMKAAALRKDIKKIKKSTKLSKEERLQLDSKAALVAHAIIDPAVQQLLVDIWSDPIPHASTTNPNEVLNLVMNKAPSYVNIFLSMDVDDDMQRHHPDVYLINPSIANFNNGDQFCKYIKVMKLRYDDLIENMNKMVGHSNEDISQDQILFQLCYRESLYDYGLIYCYFLWKGHDLSFFPINSGLKNEGIISMSPTILGKRRMSFKQNGHAKRIGMGFHSSHEGRIDGQSLSSDDGVFELNGGENSRQREEAYIAEKNATANLMQVRAEIEARNAALEHRAKELEILRGAINDKSFDKLNHQQQQILLSKYDILLNSSQIS